MPWCLRQKAPAKTQVVCVLPLPSPPTSTSRLAPSMRAELGCTRAAGNSLHRVTSSRKDTPTLPPGSMSLGACSFSFFKDISNQTCGAFSAHDKTTETPTKKRHGVCYFSTLCYVVPVSAPRVPLFPGSAVKLEKKDTERLHRMPRRRQGTTGTLQERVPAKATTPGWGKGSLWMYSPASC